MNIIENCKLIMNLDLPLKDKYCHLKHEIDKVRINLCNKEDNLPYEEVTDQETGIWTYEQSWNIFNRKQIPFELWADICEEGLELLEKLLEDPSIPYTELEGFKEFQQHIQAKFIEIEKKDPALGYKLGDMGY